MAGYLIFGKKIARITFMISYTSFNGILSFWYARDEYKQMSWDFFLCNHSSISN